MSTNLFKARTNYAYTIKILAELLQNNIKTACFDVDNKGIDLCMMDTNRTVLIKLTLDSNKFSYYKFNSRTTISLGLNLNHLHMMLKSIKKKDSIELFIKRSDPTDLGIRVIPRDNNRKTTSYLKIQNIQNLDIHIPEGYGKQPVIISSSDFQKMCKDMSHLGKHINVSSKQYSICFTCDSGSIMKRSVEFGELEYCDSDDDNEDNECLYNQDFKTEQLAHITKLSGLSNNMQIYTKNGLPLLFKSNVSELGNIAIYIKSKNLIEMEKKYELES